MPHRRLPLAFIAALAVMACAAAPASAKLYEIGSVTGAQPTCPQQDDQTCLALSRTTGYQVRVGDDRGPYRIPRDGKIVAWTVKLGDPSADEIDFFEDQSGFGEASAGITVLRTGTRKYARVVAESPVVRLEPYFGRKVQFPLDRALTVEKGWVVALTVPTWAPVLTPLLEDGSGWRASRPKDGCSDVSRQTAQTDMSDLTRYQCRYRARLAYSATFISTPKTNDER
jgi:hypothetical protein